MTHLSGDNATPAEASKVQQELSDLNARVNSLLPPDYQNCFDAVSPKSMGSAALKFDSSSRVAWDQIWTHFCDLAVAGGPPHRGSLLEVPTLEEVETEPAGYHLVCEELARGIRMTSGLAATAAPEPGWVTVDCHSPEMAAWLLRAVMAENVFVRRQEATIQVPAGPAFRIVKEIKNVVVAIAKTCHYWQQHFSVQQRSDIAHHLLKLEIAALLEPPSRPEALAKAAQYQDMATQVGQALKESLGWPIARNCPAGWVGLHLRDERTAAWFVRSAIAENILARREEHILFLPVPKLCSHQQPGIEFEIVHRMTRLRHLYVACQIDADS